MFNQKKYKFLFKCPKCSMIVSIEIEDETDLEEVRDNKLVVDCPCGGVAKVLRE